MFLRQRCNRVTTQRKKAHLREQVGLRSPRKDVVGTDAVCALFGVMFVAERC